MLKTVISSLFWKNKYCVRIKRTVYALDVPHFANLYVLKIAKSMLNLSYRDEVMFVKNKRKIPIDFKINKPLSKPNIFFLQTTSF